MNHQIQFLLKARLPTKSANEVKLWIKLPTAPAAITVRNNRNKLALADAIAAETVKQANEAVCKGQVEIEEQLKKHAKEYAEELEAA
jgi:hypothetical protein